VVYFNIIMNEILKIGLTFILVIIVTSVLQWSALAIYNIWCSPTSVSGFITHLFTLGSPLCQFINTVQYELSKKYISLWAGAAVAITSFIIAKLVIKN
jgi:hypothetical protein